MIGDDPSQIKHLGSLRSLFVRLSAISVVFAIAGHAVVTRRLLAGNEAGRGDGRGDRAVGDADPAGLDADDPSGR
ncbi:MAG: hypothetical protein IT384_22665 [Deltaproteobacteria bacterium]|nr:hypothetical protein [Deltaproteobacteria bacterium]